jgi:hypothetical protein
VDDVHALGRDAEVPQDVPFHLLGDCHHGIGGLEGGPLDPRGEVRAPAQLLPFPRSKRLQGMRGDDEGDAVQDLDQQPPEVGVPGVAVDHVGIGGTRGEADAHPQRLQHE